MPLKGKYLQYRSEITFEIFEKIYNKLIEEKWCCKNSIKTEYPWFAKHGYITHEEPQEQRNFATHTCIYGLEETTVQEILGYDPFVKKEVIEEVIPEYVECIKKDAQVLPGMIYKIQLEKGFLFDGSDDVYYINNMPYYQSFFKPSTKEAFDAQNKPKSIEKWSVGTYVLFLKNLGDFRAGYIDIINNKFDGRCTFLEKYLSMDISREKDGEVKWFSTKSEAEKFAKTLVEPVKCGNGILDAVEPKQPLKQAVHCKTQEEWDFVTEKLNYKWNNEAGTNNTWSNYGNKTFINLSEKHFNSIESKNYNFQILSFQEWCDLNGYKMKKEVKFEVGKWYICLCNKNLYKCNGNSDTNFYHSEAINPTNKIVSNIEPGLNKTNSTEALIEYFNSNKLASIEEIQQYLPDNHPDKITPVIQQTRDMQNRNNLKKGDYLYVLLPNYCGDILEITGVGDDSRYEANSIWITHKNKSFSGGGFRCSDKTHVLGVEFRLATPEEINNHLISIGQIPMGIQSSSTSDNTYNHLISYGNKIHEEFFNPTVEFERNYDYTVNPKYKQEFDIINKTKTIKF